MRMQKRKKMKLPWGEKVHQSKKRKKLKNRKSLIKNQMKRKRGRGRGKN